MCVLCPSEFEKKCSWCRIFCSLHSVQQPRACQCDTCPPMPLKDQQPDHYINAVRTERNQIENAGVTIKYLVQTKEISKLIFCRWPLLVEQASNESRWYRINMCKISLSSTWGWPLSTKRRMGTSSMSPGWLCCRFLQRCQSLIVHGLCNTTYSCSSSISSINVLKSERELMQTNRRSLSALCGQHEHIRLGYWSNVHIKSHSWQCREVCSNVVDGAYYDYGFLFIYAWVFSCKLWDVRCNDKFKKGTVSLPKHVQKKQYTFCTGG